MWKSKKFIIIAVVVGVLLVATVATVALAQTTPTPGAPKTLSARVAAILNIDQATVDAAFATAKSDMANEALDARLKALVASGKMTQAQADQYKGWWEKRPAGVPGIGMGGRTFGRGMGGMCIPAPLPRQTDPVQ
jgi:outer membrane murein-binding lipoprotein Lpp